MAKTILLSRKNDVHVELAFDAMATVPTLELAVERLKEEYGITTTPQVLEAVRRFFPERFKKVRDESVAVSEAYLVDGMLDNAQLATEGEARAARRTIEALDAGMVKEPWRVARDLADMKAKNVDKSRLLQDKPTQITVTHSVAEIFNQLQALGVIDGEVEDDVEDADVVPEPDGKPDELPPAAAA
jgi:hypothetical protein